MVVRNGKIVDVRTYGYRDIERKLPMERDTICGIASMSKTVTSAAVMMLHEEGKFELADPIARYIPELKELKVFTGGTMESPQLAKPKRSPTIRDLLTHTSGMVYGSIYAGQPTPVHQLYEQANLTSSSTLQEFVRKVGTLPLIVEPGTAFHYSVSIDVLGYLVQVTSGMPFDEFLAKRLLDPLQMRDTYFFVPKEKESRVAKLYSWRDGKLNLETPPPRSAPLGGGGLKSTIDDYARFAQMLANGGELDGVRILSRKTVELMMSDNIPGIGGMLDPGYGFGLGGSVHVDVGKSGTLGSKGDFGWMGALSTWYRIDLHEKLVALVFFQHVPIDFAGMARFSTLVYQSLN